MNSGYNEYNTYNGYRDSDLDLDLDLYLDCERFSDLVTITDKLRIMTLRDWQPESDLDSICNYCDILNAIEGSLKSNILGKEVCKAKN